MGALKLTYREELPTLKVVKGIFSNEEKSSAGIYRYGFNGQEKDDEVAGSGNSYTAEFWQYDSRTGRRWNVDPEFRKFSGKSPFSTYSGNPIIFTDPQGDADFYFNGKWIGTDGRDDNIIGVVQNKDVKKQIVQNTKQGLTVDFGELNIESKVGGVVIINSNALMIATDILNRAVTLEPFAEFSTSLRKLGNDFIPTGVPKLGGEANAESKTTQSASIPSGDISIHSHPTSVTLDENGTPGVGDARQPSTRQDLLNDGKNPKDSDEATFEKFKINIIVGFNGNATVYEGTAQEAFQRPAFINIFGSDFKDFRGKIGEKEANKISSDIMKTKFSKGKPKGSLFKKFEKKSNSQPRFN